MTTIEIQIDEKDRILKGLEKVYEKLIEFKKAKKSELVVIRDNKIVKIKPEQEKPTLDEYLDTDGEARSFAASMIHL